MFSKLRSYLRRKLFLSLYPVIKTFTVSATNYQNKQLTLPLLEGKWLISSIFHNGLFLTISDKFLLTEEDMSYILAPRAKDGYSFNFGDEVVLVLYKQ